ncbi:MAG: hypothetical protein ACE5HU_09670, partial [Acidobacteriota bacterium]
METSGEPRSGGPATDDADGKDHGRWFLYKEVVVSALYAPGGVGRKSPGSDEDRLDLSPRPPASYLGLDFVKTFTPASRANRVLPATLPLTAVDLHPRIVFDRTMMGDEVDAVRFAPQDFWVRFAPGGRDRLALTVGQFVIPYGVNPVQAPRQRFLLPIE